jgi:hypothetical protein
MDASTCQVCGAELVEVGGFELTAADFEEFAGRPLTADERRGFEASVGEGSRWRELACSRVDGHGHMFERVEGDAAIQRFGEVRAS